MDDIVKKIHDIVLKSIDEINEDAEDGEKLSGTPETVLFGGKGEGIDSFSFVMLISNIEEQILEIFGREIYLVDEKIYEKKSNPFATIGSLEEYIQEVLQEDE